VAGRRSQGGVDKGLLGGDIKAAASTLSRRINRVPRTELGGDSGKLDQLWEYPNRRIKERVEAIKDPIERERQALAHGATNHGWRIRIADDLPSEEVPTVLAHEVAHIFDEVAGQIPTKGIKKDLLKIFNDFNNPLYGQGKVRSKDILPPEHEWMGGYSKKKAPRELLAEAIRTYMVDPNYIKSAAPKAQKQTQTEISSSPEKESQSPQKGWWQDEEAMEKWGKDFMERISKNSLEDHMSGFSPYQRKSFLEQLANTSINVGHLIGI
jgi:hypothetical protein